MSAEALFSVANAIALAVWVLLVVLPRRRAASVFAAAGAALLFGVAYTAIIAARWADRSGGFSSLTGVAALFSDPWLLLAGWLHYLAFDLLVGSWIVRDAGDRAIPHIVIVPCLALTFMFGPMGWLSYMGVRAAYAMRTLRAEV